MPRVASPRETIATSWSTCRAPTRCSRRVPDEEVARNFILFGQPDVTLVVVDATRLERNLNLVLQVLEITDRVVVCVNLIDEAQPRRDSRSTFGASARDLGVPVVATAARYGEGLEELQSGNHGSGVRLRSEVQTATDRWPVRRVCVAL